ncbi:glycine amidinotransferase [Nocardiopsis tropica]|uniref:Glycine amidinotransferase n=1 Tax=Nocardiopsis tropica TaxID=109330 RepID=A0ABU7KS47_9ACTN|nr:glycine amidinotransferase [Nocardiopsis umidischolae]MEE2052123.1 glycine amidinotransferase [Nocardiopsis umidischolae]
MSTGTADAPAECPAPPPPPAGGPRPALPAVHSWDEFTRLREVVVGDATHSRVPPLSDPSAWLNCYPELTPAELRGIGAGLFPRHVIEESNEDLAVLADTLRGLGVTVHQPPAVDHGVEYAGPGWRTTGRSSYCPRDLTLVVGSALIESPSPMRARYFEAFGWRPLFQDYLLRGAHWICAPRPRLDDSLFGTDEDGFPVLGEAEPAFEAANCLRLGRDVFYQVSRSGNELGLRWLESTLGLLGDVRVHPLRGVYEGTHIDSTVCLLRPGLVLLNPERIGPDTVPEPLKGWDVLWCPPMTGGPTAVPHTLSTPWVGMNLLMVDEGTAIVDGDQTELVRLLEGRGITVVPLRLRHSRVLGGGFHCVTLDTVREGGPEDYLG